MKNNQRRPFPTLNTKNSGRQIDETLIEQLVVLLQRIEVCFNLLERPCQVLLLKEQSLLQCNDELYLVQVLQMKRCHVD